MEIITIDYKRNAQRGKQTSSNCQSNNYRVLVDKLIQLERNDWLKFYEQLKTYIQLKSIKENHKPN